MRLKIAVCDDDAIQRGYLCEVAAAWAKREKHLLELRQYGRGEDFFFDYSEEKDFDILLLDVEMPGMNGGLRAPLYRSSLSRDITNISGTVLTFLRCIIC